MLEGDLFGGIRLVAASAIVVIGALLLVSAAIGMVRQRDVFARSHALAIMDGAGFLLCALGLAIVAWDWRMALLLALLVGLRLALAPIALGLVAKIGLAAGETPDANRKPPSIAEGGL